MQFEVGKTYVHGTKGHTPFVVDAVFLVAPNDIRQVIIFHYLSDNAHHALTLNPNEYLEIQPDVVMFGNYYETDLGFTTHWHASGADADAAHKIDIDRDYPSRDSVMVWNVTQGTLAVR